jgi:cbb3-type cytochrome oxidase subunit 3
MAAEPANYGFFGLLMLGLLLIGVVVWLRRR